MKWQLASIIICLSFSTGLTVRCYNCYRDCDTNHTSIPQPYIRNCSSRCVREITVSYKSGIRSEYRTRACFNGEQCESYSMNMGHVKSISASECCDYDLCNGGPFPAVDLRPNRKMCHFCVGDNCLGTVQCEGIEDHCFTYIDAISGQELNFKGCASKSLCNEPPSSLRSSGMYDAAKEVSVKCCKGNLCNGAESVALSFLLTLLVLLSSVLLH